MKGFIILTILTVLMFNSCLDNPVGSNSSSTYDYEVYIYYPDGYSAYVSRETYNTSTGALLSSNDDYRDADGVYRWSWDDCSHSSIRLEFSIDFYSFEGGLEKPLATNPYTSTFYLNPNNPSQSITYSQ